MQKLAEHRQKSVAIILLLASSTLISGCALDVFSSDSKSSSKSSKSSKGLIESLTGGEKANINNKTKFSSSEFGVKGSPRITTSKSVRKGGGRRQIGKPYTIRGKKYYPKLNKKLNQTGMASWYGPNFHGRLTANGEVYDQYALSAAHPTMPLPSYAKVTNLENNRSVIVRVNDRGPFHSGRVIDLSARAAELLDYQNKGIAKVRVRYHSEARMDGLDEKFLMASYKGPNQPTFEPFEKPVRQQETLIALAPIPKPALSTNSPSIKPTPSAAINNNFSGATDNPLSILPTNLVNNSNTQLYKNIAIDKGTTPIHQRVRVPLAYAQTTNTMPTFEEYQQEYAKAFPYLDEMLNEPIEISLGKFTPQVDHELLVETFKSAGEIHFNSTQNTATLITSQKQANAALHYARFIGLSSAYIK